MTLADAVEQFVSMFPEDTPTVDPKQQETKDLPVCWSGGTRAWDVAASPFALYATRDAAVAEWLSTAKSVVEGEQLHWVLKPVLLEFQVTIADSQGRHRAVGNRFAVKSQFTTKAPSND